MDTSRHLLIGQILADLGYLNLNQVNEARRKQMAYPHLKLREILVAMQVLAPEQLEQGLQVQNKVE